MTQYSDPFEPSTDPTQDFGGPPRDAGSRGAAILSWIAIAALIGVVLMLHRVAPAPPPVAAVAVEPPTPMITLMGRYAVGAKSMMPAADADTLAPLATQMQTIAEGYPEDRLRAAIVTGELKGPEAALAALDEIEEEHPLVLTPPDAADAPADPDAPLPISADLQSDIDLVRAIFRGDVVERDPAAHTGFVERHQFFAETALSQGQPDSAPLRAAVVARAQRTTAVMLVGVGTLFCIGIAGFVVGILAVAWLAKGRIRAAYAPPAPGGSVYIEAFALFLFIFLAINIVAMVLEKATGQDFTPLLIWLVPLAAFYPLLRGVPWSQHKYAIGWHTGRGVFREIGAAVVGYLAGIPIVAAGIGLTFLLMQLSALLSPGEPSAPPSHPIMDKIGTGGALGVLSVFLLASVWAPLTEESLFRGALYHHLRGRWRPFFGALFVGLIFAVVHPQGFVAIPALASLGFVFCLMREWRGSLIAPMLSHGVHNGAIMAALYLALS